MTRVATLYTLGLIFSLLVGCVPASTCVEAKNDSPVPGLPTDWETVLNIDLMVDGACTGTGVQRVDFLIDAKDASGYKWNTCDRLGHPENLVLTLNQVEIAAESAWTLRDLNGDNCDTDGDGVSDSSEVFGSAHLANTYYLANPWSVDPGENELGLTLNMSGASIHDMAQVTLTTLVVTEDGALTSVSDAPIEGYVFLH